jgi:predicted DsbA family dithiol-disulfide isomerase
VSAEPDGGPPVLEIVEFTDPACPWAWGSEPTFRALRHALGAQVAWRRVFGILFDEDDDPAPDPDAETRWYRDFIAGIAAHTGAPHTPRLQWVARTSWPASLAAKAAEAQSAPIAERVLRRLREATFVLGTPADTADGVMAAVSGIPGLDTDRLLRDMRSEATGRAVRRDWRETRRPDPYVLRLDAPGPHGGRAKSVNGRHRYALPTLLFKGPAGTAIVPGWRPYEEYRDAVGDVAPGLCTVVARPCADEALDCHRSLTEPELTLLTGEPDPPRQAVRVDTGTGPLWLHPDEARVHPALSPAQPARAKREVKEVSANETPPGIH